MSKILLTLITGLAIVGCCNPPKNNNDLPRNPATIVTEDKPVVLEGKKASDLISLLEKADAVEDSEDPCSMGKCHTVGRIFVSCQSPNGPKNEDGTTTCQVYPIKQR